VHTKEPVAAVDPHRNRKLLAVAGVVLVLLLAGLWGNRVLAGKRAILDALTQSKAQLEKKLVLLDPDVKQAEVLREWNDTAIPWLDELYDLTAHFPYKEGMRVTRLNTTTVTSKTKSKEKTTVRMEITGVVLPADQSLVQELVATINQDPHTPASPPQLASGALGGPDGKQPAGTFKFKVDVHKQPAAQYTTNLWVPPAAAARQKGRFRDDEDLGPLMGDQP
jgi:hypothetical protein